MKYKIIIIIFLTLQSYSTQAGVGKILVEMLEPLFKQSDEIPQNIVTKNDTVAIQGIKTVARPLLKELSHYNKNSDEYKIINIIANDLEICNANDINKYLDYVNFYVHNKSPIKNTLLSSENKDFYKRYKINCSIDDIDILGIGTSIDEVNKFAYVVVTGYGLVSGFVSLTYKSIMTFKLENTSWKLWNEVLVDENIKILKQNWWSYNREISKCELLNKDDALQPLNILENSEGINCSTGGLIKENFLIISCKSKEIDGNLIYFKTKNECRKFGSSPRKNNINNL